jgi:hypothetical protein
MLRLLLLLRHRPDPSRPAAEVGKSDTGRFLSL